MSRISPPAQKLPPAPRRTTTRSSSLSSSASNTAISSSTIAKLIALRTSGRLKVTCRIDPRNSSASSLVSGNSKSGMRCSAFLLLGQDTHQFTDDPEHDLVGAAADRDQPAVTVGADDLALVHVAHAAVELHAPVGDLASQA